MASLVQQDDLSTPPRITASPPSSSNHSAGQGGKQPMSGMPGGERLPGSSSSAASSPLCPQHHHRCHRAPHRGHVAAHHQRGVPTDRQRFGRRGDPHRSGARLSIHPPRAEAPGAAGGTQEDDGSLLAFDAFFRCATAFGVVSP